MSGCGTRIVLRGQKPLALCDRCPCFGSLFPPLAALTFAASSIICAFGLASAAPRSPYRHLELCGIAFGIHKGFQRLLCLESCLCLWNIRHFLCFQVHLKCKLINRGKHEPAFGFPVPSRSKTSKRPALLHGKMKKIREGRFPQLSHKIISSIKLRLPFPPWPAPSAVLLGKCSCSACRSPHYANSRQGASSARR